MSGVRIIVFAIAILSVVAGCSPATSSSPPSSEGSSTSSPVASGSGSSVGSLVILGRIVTMADPPVVEAIFIEDGAVVAVGTRDDVLAVSGEGIHVVDIGQNVAYPGFIDAHAHWIGDRDYYQVGSALEAIDLALERGWTSISEQWVNQERLDELTSLAADGALPLRVDAYLALNYGKEFFGDWYESRVPGSLDDWLRVRGVKVHSDDGWGTIVNWEPANLSASISRANEAGWQVSVHTMSAAAHELVLDAFEAAIGPSGPNPLHHRIEHATQVTDEALARMVAMDLALVIHLEGEADWILHEGFLGQFDRDDPGPEIAAQVGRWRDFVDAGLHVASATDAPWTFADDFVLEDDMARPVDQIAAGMDGQARLVPETPAWLLDQTLTAEQGLLAVTKDAAWALGDEGRRGHLAPGTLGDITILSGDVTDATPDEIRTTRVVATIVGGIPAYCGDPKFCSQFGD